MLATVNALEHAIARLIERGFFGDNANHRAVATSRRGRLALASQANGAPVPSGRRCDQGRDCVVRRWLPAMCRISTADRASTRRRACRQAKALSWKRKPRADGRERPRPMVVVATAGGGIRAAYWTATVLNGSRKNLARRAFAAISSRSAASRAAASARLCSRRLSQTATRVNAARLAQRRRNSSPRISLPRRWQAGFSRICLRFCPGGKERMRRSWR